MAMENEHRKEALTRLGEGCLHAWHGRMASLTPEWAAAASVDLALPHYRAWLGGLAELVQGWVALVDERASLTASLLPWHWLGMGRGVPVAVRLEGASSVAPSRRNGPVQPQPQRRSVASGFPKDGSEHGSVVSPFPGDGFEDGSVVSPFLEEGSPSSPPPARGLRGAAAKGRSGPWAGDEGAGRQLASLDATASAETRQVSFRGLDAFVSYVQQPLHPATFHGEPEDVGPLAWVDPLAASLDAPPAHLPMVVGGREVTHGEKLGGGWVDKPGEKGSAPMAPPRLGLDGGGDSRSPLNLDHNWGLPTAPPLADLPPAVEDEGGGGGKEGVDGKPGHLDKGGADGKGGNGRDNVELRVHGPAEAVPASREKLASLPSWEEVPTTLEQLMTRPAAQVPGLRWRGIPPSETGWVPQALSKQGALQGPQVAAPAFPAAVPPAFPEDGTGVDNAAALNGQSSVRLSLGQGGASPALASLSGGSLPVWPSDGSARPPLQDGAALVAEMMDSLVLQLQRDFKRHYGI